jgi:nucleotide-binding universal stress UspA family protein
MDNDLPFPVVSFEVGEGNYHSEEGRKGAAGIQSLRCFALTEDEIWKGGGMYRKILVPLDGSKLAECVLPHVETIASACQAESVIFVRVVEVSYPAEGMGYAFSPGEMSRIQSADKSWAESYLKKLLSSLPSEKIRARAEVLMGRTAEKLVEFAAKNAIDLIIIATHGRSGVSRWVWGSTAEQILRSSCVPVLMVRAPGCAPDA